MSKNEIFTSRNTIRRLFVPFILAIFLPSILSAHDFEMDGIYYIKNSDGNSVSVSYRGTDSWEYPDEYTGAVTIPPSVTYSGKTYSVTAIGDNAFSGCSSLTSIKIPNSVTEIGHYAFEDCSGLTSVTIPNSVSSIGGGAFYNTPWYNSQPDGLVYAGLVAYKYKGSMQSGTSIVIKDGTLSVTGSCFRGCNGLTSVTIPNSVTSIGGYAFEECGDLTSVTIPNSVTTINSGTFQDCSGLTSVTIPNSVTTIGEDAFYDCIGLTSITIPSSVTSIEYEAFYNCNGLQSIVVESGNTTYDSRDNCNAIIKSSSNMLILGCNNTVIPNSITSIENEAFYGCSGLTSVTIPNSVTTIGYDAFGGCSGLTSVAIPNSVTAINGGTFGGCSGLTSVTIPNSVTTIGNNAFRGCSGLTSVTFPNSVSSIGYGAFLECDGLTDVWNYSHTPQAIDDYIFSVYNKLHVPKSAVGAYTAADVWKNFEVIGFDPYGETLTFDKDAPTHDAVVIGFDNSTPDVIIPETITVDGVEYEVTGVADEAFRNCDNLKSVEIPATVREVGESAFRGCSSHERVVLPDLSAPAATLKHLSTKAASTNVLIIGDYAFADCSALNEVRNNSLAPQAVNETVFSGVNVSNCKLYVPEQSMNLYKEAAIWKDFIIEGFVGVEDIFIDRPSIEKTVVGYYDLRGIRHDEPVRGQINIVLFSDGTAKKVVVR